MRYRICFPVLECTGEQVYEVEADDAEHAMRLWDEGQVEWPTNRRLQACRDDECLRSLSSRMRKVADGHASCGRGLYR